MSPSQLDKFSLFPLKRDTSPRVDCRGLFSSERHTTALSPTQGGVFSRRDQFFENALKSTQDVVTHGAPLPLIWVLVLDNIIPDYAVPFSEAYGGPQFIVRALLEGHYCIGVAGTGLPLGALIWYQGRQLTVKRYEVLCFATEMRWGITGERDFVQQSSFIVSNTVKHSVFASQTEESMLLCRDITRVISDDKHYAMSVEKSRPCSSPLSPISRHVIEEIALSEAERTRTGGLTRRSSLPIGHETDRTDSSSEFKSQRHICSRMCGCDSLDVQVGKPKRPSRLMPEVGQAFQRIRKISTTTQSDQIPDYSVNEPDSEHSQLRRSRSLSAMLPARLSGSRRTESTAEERREDSHHGVSPVASVHATSCLSPIGHFSFPEPFTDSAGPAPSIASSPQRQTWSIDQIISRGCQDFEIEQSPDGSSRAKTPGAVRVSSPLAGRHQLANASSVGATHRPLHRTDYRGDRVSLSDTEAGSYGTTHTTTVSRLAGQVGSFSAGNQVAGSHESKPHIRPISKSPSIRPMLTRPSTPLRSIGQPLANVEEESDDRETVLMTLGTGKNRLKAQDTVAVARSKTADSSVASQVKSPHRSKGQQSALLQQTGLITPVPLITVSPSRTYDPGLPSPVQITPLEVRIDVQRNRSTPRPTLSEKREVPVDVRSGSSALEAAALATAVVASHVGSSNSNTYPTDNGIRGSKPSYMSTRDARGGVGVQPRHGDMIRTRSLKEVDVVDHTSIQGATPLESSQSRPRSRFGSQNEDATEFVSATMTSDTVSLDRRALEGQDKRRGQKLVPTTAPQVKTLESRVETSRKVVAPIPVSATTPIYFSLNPDNMTRTTPDATSLEGRIVEAKDTRHLPRKPASRAPSTLPWVEKLSESSLETSWKEIVPTHISNPNNPTLVKNAEYRADLSKENGIRHSEIATTDRYWDERSHGTPSNARQTYQVPVSEYLRQSDEANVSHVALEKHKEESRPNEPSRDRRKGNNDASSVQKPKENVVVEKRSPPSNHGGSVVGAMLATAYIAAAAYEAVSESRNKKRSESPRRGSPVIEPLVVRKDTSSVVKDVNVKRNEKQMVVADSLVDGRETTRRQTIMVDDAPGRASSMGVQTSVGKTESQVHVDDVGAYPGVSIVDVGADVGTSLPTEGTATIGRKVISGQQIQEAKRRTTAGICSDQAKPMQTVSAHAGEQAQREDAALVTVTSSVEQMTDILSERRRNSSQDASPDTAEVISRTSDTVVLAANDQVVVQERERDSSSLSSDGDTRMGTVCNTDIKVEETRKQTENIDRGSVAVKPTSYRVEPTNQSDIALSRREDVSTLSIDIRSGSTSQKASTQLDARTALQLTDTTPIVQPADSITTTDQTKESLTIETLTTSSDQKSTRVLMNVEEVQVLTTDERDSSYGLQRERYNERCADSSSSSIRLAPTRDDEGRIKPRVDKNSSNGDVREQTRDLAVVQDSEDRYGGSQGRTNQAPDTAVIERDTISTTTKTSVTDVVIPGPTSAVDRLRETTLTTTVITSLSEQNKDKDCTEDRVARGPLRPLLPRPSTNVPTSKQSSPDVAQIAAGAVVAIAVGTDLINEFAYGDTSSTTTTKAQSTEKRNVEEQPADSERLATTNAKVASLPPATTSKQNLTVSNISLESTSGYTETRAGTSGATVVEDTREVVAEHDVASQEHEVAFSSHTESSSAVVVDRIELRPDASCVSSDLLDTRASTATLSSSSRSITKGDVWVSERTEQTVERFADKDFSGTSPREEITQTVRMRSLTAMNNDSGWIPKEPPPSYQDAVSDRSESSTRPLLGSDVQYYGDVKSSSLDVPSYGDCKQNEEGALGLERRPAFRASNPSDGKDCGKSDLVSVRGDNVVGVFKGISIKEEENSISEVDEVHVLDQQIRVDSSASVGDTLTSVTERQIGIDNVALTSYEERAVTTRSMSECDALGPFTGNETSTSSTSKVDEKRVVDQNSTVITSRAIATQQLGVESLPPLRPIPSSDVRATTTRSLDVVDVSRHDEFQVHTSAQDDGRSDVTDSNTTAACILPCVTSTTLDKDEKTVQDDNQYRLSTTMTTHTEDVWESVSPVLSPDSANVLRFGVDTQSHQDNVVVHDVEVEDVQWIPGIQASSERPLIDSPSSDFMGRTLDVSDVENETVTLNARTDIRRERPSGSKTTAPRTYTEIIDLTCEGPVADRPSSSLLTSDDHVTREIHYDIGEHVDVEETVDQQTNCIAREEEKKSSQEYVASTKLVIGAKSDLESQGSTECMGPSEGQQVEQASTEELTVESVRTHVQVGKDVSEVNLQEGTTQRTQTEVASDRCDTVVCASSMQASAGKDTVENIVDLTTFDVEISSNVGRIENTDRFTSSRKTTETVSSNLGGRDQIQSAELVTTAVEQLQTASSEEKETLDVDDLDEHSTLRTTETMDTSARLEQYVEKSGETLRNTTERTKARRDSSVVDSESTPMVTSQDRQVADVELSAAKDAVTIVSSNVDLMRGGNTRADEASLESGPLSLTDITITKDEVNGAQGQTKTRSGGLIGNLDKSVTVTETVTLENADDHDQANPGVSTVEREQKRSLSSENGDVRCSTLYSTETKNGFAHLEGVEENETTLQSTVERTDVDVKHTVNILDSTTPTIISEDRRETDVGLDSRVVGNGAAAVAAVAITGVWASDMIMTGSRPRLNRATTGLDSRTGTGTRSKADMVLAKYGVDGTLRSASAAGDFWKKTFDASASTAGTEAQKGYIAEIASSRELRDNNREEQVELTISGGKVTSSEAVDYRTFEIRETLTRSEKNDGRVNMETLQNTVEHPDEAGEINMQTSTSTSISQDRRDMDIVSDSHMTETGMEVLATAVAVDLATSEKDPTTKGVAMYDTRDQTGVCHERASRMIGVSVEDQLRSTVQLPRSATLGPIPPAVVDATRPRRTWSEGTYRDADVETAKVGVDVLSVHDEVDSTLHCQQVTLVEKDGDAKVDISFETSSPVLTRRVTTVGDHDIKDKLIDSSRRQTFDGITDRNVPISSTDAYRIDSEFVSAESVTSGAPMGSSTEYDVVQPGKMTHIRADDATVTSKSGSEIDGEMTRILSRRFWTAPEKQTKARLHYMPSLDYMEGFRKEWADVDLYDIAERGVLHRSLSRPFSITTRSMRYWMSLSEEGMHSLNKQEDSGVMIIYQRRVPFGRSDVLALSIETGTLRRVWIMFGWEALALAHQISLSDKVEHVVGNGILDGKHAIAISRTAGQNLPIVVVMASVDGKTFDSNEMVERILCWVNFDLLEAPREIHMLCIVPEKTIEVAVELQETLCVIQDILGEEGIEIGRGQVEVVEIGYWIRGVLWRAGWIEERDMEVVEDEISDQ